MKIIFFIVGTPIFFAFLYVIRLLLGLEYSVEYDEDLVVTSDFVSNLSRIIVIYIMGFLPIYIMVTILGGILAHIIPFSIYKVLYILTNLIAYAMGIIKYRKNSKRFNSFSGKKKWILCCLAFGFLIGLVETKIASAFTPCSTIEIIIGYVSCIAWSLIISGGYEAVVEMFLKLIVSLLTNILGVFNKIFGEK